MTLLAFYDLAVSPVSFDFMHFLIGAQHFAQGENLHVVIVPGPGDGFKEEDHKPISTAEKIWRVDHILVPLCRMIGATVTVLRRREEAEAFKSKVFYPLTFGNGEPDKSFLISVAKRAMDAGMVPRFEASERAREHVKRLWGCGENLVTITLRSTHSVMRNSNIATWTDVHLGLKSRGYWPVFISDTGKMGEAIWLAEFPDPLAACDLDIRAALYDAAVMNLSASGGPFSLCYLDAKRPFLFFLHLFEKRLMADQTGRLHFHPTAEWMELMGIPPGSQLPFSAPNRRIVWRRDDDAELILDQFDKATSTRIKEGPSHDQAENVA